MLTLQTTSVITLTLVVCAMASPTLAQAAPQTLKKTHPILSQSIHPVVPTESVQSPFPNDRAAPDEISPRKIIRIEEPVSTPANATQPQNTSMSRSLINAASSDQSRQTRFIYDRMTVKTQMPVYFSTDAQTSK